MEKKYVEPEMEVTMFDACDVITTSGDQNISGGDITLPDHEW